MNKDCGRFYKRLDKDQKEYYHSIMDNPVTCCNARAGTGKTTIATMAGLELLEQGNIAHIIYLRFPDQMLQSLGAFPGSLQEKEQYYMEPFFEACEDLGLTREMVLNLISDERVILCTSIAMRGVNFKDSLVIIDEAQNAGFKDLKLVLTRLHDDCHCAIIGHSNQVDNIKNRQEQAFETYMYHLNKKPWTKIVTLSRNYRGKISNWADSLMIDHKNQYYVTK